MSPARNLLIDLATAQLRDGEQLLAGFPAVAQPPAAASPLGRVGALPLLGLSRRRAASRAVVQAAGKSALPLAPRMLMAITDQRIIVWSVKRGWKPEKLLGDLSRERVIGAEAPTVGRGWRTVVIHLDDGERLGVKVVARDADSLAAELSLAR